MKKRITLSKKILAVMLCCLMALSLLAGLQGVKSTSKAAESNQYVYFGNYCQKEVTNQNEIKTIWDIGKVWQNNTAVINGITVKRKSNIIEYDGFRYYKSAPIKWKVLSDDGDSYLLLSDKILDSQTYSSSTGWPDSGIRKWCNDTFYNEAFTNEEKNDLIEETLDNDCLCNNPIYTHETIESKDYVWLLDEDDVTSEKYGFSANSDASDTRIAYNTQYLSDEESAGTWYLRGDPYWYYYNSYVGQYIYKNGGIHVQSSVWDGQAGGNYAHGVRPVIRVKKNSKYLYVKEPKAKEISAEKKLTKNTTAANVNSKQYIVTGKYKDGQLKKVFTDKELYTDEYFENKKGALKIQGGLVKLSMLAASSVYNKKYAEKLMDNCKFSVHKYVKKKPTKAKNDTISYDVGIKRCTNGTTLVAIWIKGTSGNYEWVSNWNLGKGKTHSGFKKAEKDMNEEINAYLKSKNVYLQKSGKIKFWITGHSRGAAVANLYAKRMNGKVGKKNVYAYTFAAPRVSKSGKKKGYENIINYINSGDFVTEVAPRKWGYLRFGVDKKLSASKKTGMKELFKKISGKKYKGFGKKGKESLLKVFLDYAGAKSKDYFKGKNKKDTPEFFCKNGLGYILAGKKVGVKNCLVISATHPKAAKVFAKMIVDGKLNPKFGHAHTQLTYLSWLKKMYK